MTIETYRILLPLMFIIVALTICIVMKIKHATRNNKKENIEQPILNKEIGSPEENDLVVAVLNKMNIDNLNKQSVYDRITFNIAENTISIRVYNDNYGEKYSTYICGFIIKGHDNNNAIGKKSEQIYNEWIAIKYKKATYEIEGS